MEKSAVRLCHRKLYSKEWRPAKKTQDFLVLCGKVSAAATIATSHPFTLSWGFVPFPFADFFLYHVLFCLALCFVTFSFRSLSSNFPFFPNSFSTCFVPRAKRWNGAFKLFVARNNNNNSNDRKTERIQQIYSVTSTNKHIILLFTFMVFETVKSSSKTMGIKRHERTQARTNTQHNANLFVKV